jgi:NADH:ubiquinone oxidoreductase subunit F (NADH-binding)
MTVLDPPVTTQRLLAGGSFGPMPSLSLTALTRLAEEAGLTGRGGAGFPSAIKLRSVADAGRRPAVVGNGMEGEPLSHKDAVLLTTAPGLVLDGLTLVSRALRAGRTVLAVGPDIDPRPALAEARRRGGVEVRHLAGGFVAGQETALLNQLEGRAAVPRDPMTRVTTRGLDGRPTLVSNVETLAHLALAARFGASWFGSVGLADDPGTSLFTITGAVHHEGVVEAARGTTIRDLVATASPHPGVQAVLVGGYHGAWVPATDFDTRLTRADLAPYGASVGAGIVHVLAGDACPLRAAADMASYLAGESAAQCGPCLNGLPRIADSLQRLAHGSRDARLPAEIERLRALVVGRGACAHPDGTARLVASTMRTFDAHVAAHLSGWCPTELTGGPR